MPDRPIRVLHVLPHVLEGGVERRRVLLAEQLGAELEMRIACLTGRGPVRERIEAAGVPVIEMDRRHGRGVFDPRVHARMHALLLRWRPDIVHGAIFEGMIWGATAGLLQRVPVVLLEETSYPTDDGPAGFRRSRWTRGALRLIAGRSSGVVAVAPRIRDYLIEEQGLAPERVHLVMNGVADFELAAPDAVLAERRRLGFDDDSIVIGSVGRMNDAHKKFSDLLKAARQVRDRGHDVRVLLVGEGHDRPMLEELAAELDLTAHAVFTGRREDRELFFALMDVFVLSSATEAAPLALIEAMMASRPSVATRVGGVEDIAADEENALLVPSNAPTRIADAVERLLVEPGLRDTLAQAARRHAADNLSARRYADDVASLYRRCLASRA